MLMKPYTKTGDTGETNLLHKRISKTDNVIICLGSIDETAAAISVARTELENLEITEILLKIENKLSRINGIIAGSSDVVHDDEIKKIEDAIDEYHIQKEGFTRPKTEEGALLEFARTVCRRAEINILKLQGIPENILKFMNRLSDLLYVLVVYCDENQSKS